ncbi:MAG TPA: cysteine dioxygenase family protein [Streptosporangiaceae bacterium]|jgi:hypothetical protein
MTTTVSHAALSPHRLGELAGQVAARSGEWGHLVRFGAGQRWHHRLELAAGYEIWLLSWLPGQRTGFHDHGDAAGAFAVACGQLCERTVPPGQRAASSRTLATGTVRSFGSRYVHDVLNLSAGLAVSVHAYSPPLTAMRRYELTTAGLAQAGTGRAGRDW